MAGHYLFNVGLILRDGGAEITRELGTLDMQSAQYGELSEQDAVNAVLDGITTRPALGLMQWGAHTWPAATFGGITAQLVSCWAAE